MVAAGTVQPHLERNRTWDGTAAGIYMHVGAASTAQRSMCAAKHAVESGQLLRDAYRNRSRGRSVYSRFTRLCLQLESR